MRGKNTLFSAVVILLVLGSPVFAYRQLIDLGTLGGQQSCAYSINDKGQIVGWAGQNPGSSGDQKACLFDSTGGGANINLQPAVLVGGAAQSINNKGQIVGWANDPMHGHEYACLFDSTGAGANKSLEARNGQGSHAYSINDSGQIVGNIYVEFIYWHACVFDSTGNGANKDIGRGCAYSNNQSEVVGSRVKACIFDISGGGANTYLGALGGSQSEALSINDIGQIVGRATINNPDPWIPDITHACLFDSSGNGNNIDLGTLGGDYSEAASINDIGQIVGWSLVATGNPFDRRACLFDPTGHGNNIDLNTLIAPTSGWTLNYAYCINNSGWIVGEGTYHGNGRAFLLTPEPASALIMAVGAIIATSRRRRR
jgi:probable HAF family extracellular repeat protein